MDLNLIDDYFQHKLTDAEKENVEKRILLDEEFAEDVAFYSHTKAILRENILAEKHKEWTNQLPEKGKTINFTRFGLGIAASILIFMGIWFFGQNDTKNDTNLASNFVSSELATLPLKMDAAEDSLELGKKYYNEKDYKNAIAVFENLSKKQLKAKEFLGLSYLQSKDYDKSIEIFKAQAQNPDLLNNKGKFYLALAYAQKGDLKTAEQIFKEIRKNNLVGKTIIEDWQK